jgi:hypothetical protein
LPRETRCRGRKWPSTESGIASVNGLKFRQNQRPQIDVRESI